VTRPPAEDPRPKVSVVIPSWNGREHLPMVLNSMVKQTLRSRDITVVNDGSVDDTVAYLKAEWPDVRLIDLGENRGFAVSCDTGYEATTGEYVVIANNDIEFEPDWLERLAAELDADPRLGFITTKIAFHDERDVLYQAGHDYYVYGLCESKGLNETDRGQFDSRGPTAAATGAGSMFRRDAVNSAGGLFDADYWMYCEDIDLGLRLLQQGYRGLYLPEPVGYHVGSATMGAFPDKVRFHFWRNQLITLVKDVPARILLAALPKIILYHYFQWSVERKRGSGRLVLNAYAAFLRALPKSLVKRRRVMSGRKISTAEFRSYLLSDYPFPTRFRRLAEVLRLNLIDRPLRFGGDLLGYLPEPIRPRIRLRDRTPRKDGAG
jgi:GT2 family glycosyltransferase